MGFVVQVSAKLQFGVLSAWTRTTLSLDARTGLLSAKGRELQVRGADVTHSRLATSVLAPARRPTLWSLRPASDTARTRWRAFTNALSLAARSPPGFRLLRELGSGGSGVVYEALAEKKRTHVALKLVPRGSTADCAAESRMARRRIRHPNLLAPRRAFHIRSHLVVVMPLADAGSLLDLTRATTRDLPVPRVRRAMRDLLSALAALHDSGIAHRDVKLENILLDAAGNAALADFGLADLVPRNGFATAAGTRYTQAPEVGVMRYGTPADVWSAGVVLIVLLVRAVPFADDAAREKLLAKMRYLDDPLAALLSARRRTAASPELLHLLRGLLALDPSRRFTAHQALAHPWLVEEAAQPTLPSSLSFATLVAIKLRLHRAVRAMRFRRASLESVEDALVCVNDMHPKHDGKKHQRSIAAVVNAVRFVQGICAESTSQNVEQARKLPTVQRAAEAGERVLSGILSRQPMLISS